MYVLRQIFPLLAEHGLVVFLHFLFPVHLLPERGSRQPQIVVVLAELLLHPRSLLGVKLPVCIETEIISLQLTQSMYKVHQGPSVKSGVDFVQKNMCHHYPHYIRQN